MRMLEKRKERKEGKERRGKKKQTAISNAVHQVISQSDRNKRVVGGKSKNGIQSQKDRNCCDCCKRNE